MKNILAFLSVLLFTTAALAQGNRKIKVGKTAPELIYANPAGEKINLAEIAKDRIVLVDFWASWCGPCRYSSPNLVRMYNYYKSKTFRGAPAGFTILSVSLDSNPAAWRLAIQQDGLLWPFHMADLEHSGEGPAKKYGVQYIPQAFLVGPDGKVLGKFDDAAEATNILESLLQR